MLDSKLVMNEISSTKCSNRIVEPITRASAMASCNPVSEVALPSTGTRIFSYMDKSSEKTHRSPAHHHHRD
jgi:hypothetical protein